MEVLTYNLYLVIIRPYQAMTNLLSYSLKYLFISSYQCINQHE
uniref:Uncharacterized protein n=3 Tax=unclassified bacterial viruses TaxID=12333 RepID=A0AAU8KVE4_9VIRU